MLHIGLVLSVGILAATYCGCAAPSAQGSTAFDGHWWVSATLEERLGFVNGVADCRTYELGHKLTAPRSAEEEEKLVTTFYKTNASKLDFLVIQAISRFDKVKGVPRPEGGEVWDEPHAYWDGLWWKGSSELERLGFVEGYLSCLEQKPRKPIMTYSKSPQEYVRLISEWYKLDDRTHAIDSVRESEKIANVLRRFFDGPKSSK